MFIISFILCLLGFLSFSLANKKHFSVVYDDKELTQVSQWSFHIIAWVLLIIAANITTSLWSLEIGLTIWVGLLQLASVLISLLFTYSQSLYIFCCKYLLPTTLLTRVTCK